MDAQFAWLRLLAQIDHLMRMNGSPRGQRSFRGLGAYRRAAAHRQLLRERQRLLAEAERLGVSIDPGALASTPSTLAHHDDLALHYLAAAFGYRVTAELSTLKAETRLTRWMSERARLHEGHSRFLSGG